jgi:hypothetical protein
MEDLAERVGALEARKATVFEGDMGIAPLDEVTLLISAVLVFCECLTLSMHVLHCHGVAGG